MSQVLVSEGYLSGIADAIREKLETTDAYKPSQMAAAIRSIAGEGFTKIKMESIVGCYLYGGGNRGWAVYPGTSEAQNGETFYADIPTAFQNGGLLLLTTSRPAGATFEFTRNRIGFTDGTEDVENLPDGITEGRTTPPDYYLNSLSSDRTKEFTFVKVPAGKNRIYWTNTQSSYRVAGQSSHMWLIEDDDLADALNINWTYSIAITS